MNLSEKVQYLNGLMDGLGIDDSTDTGKVLLAMKDVLDEICETVDGIDSDVDDIVDFCNAMDEDLHNVEEALFDDGPHDEPPHGPHGDPHGPHHCPHGPHHCPHGPHHGPHDHDHCCHHHEEDEPFPFDDDDDFMFMDDELLPPLPPLWKGSKEEDSATDEIGDDAAEETADEDKSEE